MPFVTVIVPVYNTEVYLCRCIDSILSQSFSDFELLLVDDGSPDNSGKICDDYASKDGRIKVIHKTNGGVSAARNDALGIAAGETVTFCDSDDYLLPNYLFDLVNAKRVSGADLVLSGYIRVEKGKETEQYHQKSFTQTIESKEDKFEYIDNLSRWECCSSLFDLSIIRQNGIEFCLTCNNFAEDYGFMLEYLLFGKCVCSIDCCNYCYVQHSESMMAQSNNVVKMNEMNEIAIHFSGFFFLLFPKDKKEYSVIFNEILCNQYRKIDFLHITKNEMIRLRSTVQNIGWFDKWMGIYLNLFPGLIKVMGLKRATNRFIDLHFLRNKFTHLFFMKQKYIMRKKRRGTVRNSSNIYN